MSQSKTYPTRNTLALPIREKAITLLNQSLADMIDLHSQTKQAHWNLKGIHFHTLHLFFDTLAGSVDEYVDLLAERTTALGGAALGTVRMSARASRLPEYPVDAVEGRQHLEALSERYALLGSACRSAIDTCAEFGDANTADVFTEISRALEQHLWMLESHLVGK